MADDTEGSTSADVAGDVSTQLLAACQSGDAHALQSMMSSVAGVDLSMKTEGGVTLLMHTIIGAGILAYDRAQLLNSYAREFAGVLRNVATQYERSP